MDAGSITENNYDFFKPLILGNIPELPDGTREIKLGLSDKGIACGALTGHLTSTEFVIDSFYVAPDYRGKNGGTMLLRMLTGLLAGTGFPIRISFTETEDDHRILSLFLKAKGFSDESDEKNNIFVTTLGTVGKLPFFKLDKADFGEPLSSLSDVRLNAAGNYLERHMAPIPDDGLMDSDIDRFVSRIAIGGKEVSSLFLVSKQNDALWLSTIYSSAGADRNSLPRLFISAFSTANKLYEKTTNVYFHTVNDATFDLMMGMLPDIRPISKVFVRA